MVGRDPNIVFEHPGRTTMGASVFVASRGGTIVTCAATSGYMIEYDNRHLWMKLKTIKGSHFANYREAWAANQAIVDGKVHPILSEVYPLEETGEAAYRVHHNLHAGKIGILCLADGEGQGIRNEELRSKHQREIELFRQFGK
jgi:crotonyl-CoA reductase